jgi:hypothetical protein
MNRIAKMAVKGAFGAMVLGALGLGATQALASPGPEGEPYYCYMQCQEDCSGGDGWRCIGNDCICW